jgi:5'-3' exonuclease
MKLLIDGDIIVYRIGFASQTTDKETGLVIADPESHALHSCKLYLDKVVEESGCDSFTVYLTPKTNFRKKVRDDYKANRKDKAKPVHVGAIRKYLISKYKAKEIEGMEADDALGLKQDSTTCIASIDKDLLMCEGRHYNFVKKEHTTTTPEQGTKFFYQQMIMGDAVDNIMGIKGLGKVKSLQLLDMTPRKEWDDMILDLYIEHFGYAEGRNRCVQNSQLLWILQRDKQMPMDFSYEPISK